MFGPLIGILICITLSAYFSATEIAFASVKQHRLKTKAELDNKYAVKALEIIDNFDEALSSILIGNNLVNIVASAISTVLIISLVGRSGGTAISTIIMTVVILIFGEIVPKIIARENPEKFVLFSAPILAVLMKVLKPVNKLVVFILDQTHKIWPPPESSTALTEAHLASIIETVEDEGIFDEEASDLMQSALDFPDIMVSEIVTPRVEMFAVDIEDDMEEIIEDLLDSTYSRIPVYEESIDNIVGILNLSNFLKVLADNPQITKEEFRDLLTEEISIPETMKLPKVFNILNQGLGQMAVLVDEYGGTVGIVTIEDLLEELVGDIWDEYDEIEEEEIVQKSENFYEVLAATSIRDFADEFDLDYEDIDSDYNTVGGLVLEKFGRFPEVGESIDYENLIFTITEADATKLYQVQVEVKEEEEELD